MILLLLLCALGFPAHAQQAPVQDCHGVITSSLASGREHPHFPRCAAESVPYVSRAIREAAQRDVERFTMLAQLAFFMRDPAIFDAGLELARREGVDPTAKVLGLVVALRQVAPDIAFQGGETRPFHRPLSERCGDEVVFPTLPTHYRWLDRGSAQNASVRLRAAATTLSLAAGSPLIVRRFADCVLFLIPDPADEVTEALPDTASACWARYQSPSSRRHIAQARLRRWSNTVDQLRRLRR